MSDLTGTYIFNRSAHCEIASPSDFCAAANEFCWIEEFVDNGSYRWVRDDVGIGFSEREVMFPNISLKIPEFVVFEENGLEKKVPYYELSEKERDKWDIEYRIVTLEEISNRIAPYIQQGWVEFSFAGYERGEYIVFTALKIYSSGRVDRKIETRSYFDSLNRSINEEFNPMPQD